MNIGHTHFICAQTPFEKADWSLLSALARLNAPVILGGWLNPADCENEFQLIEKSRVSSVCLQFGCAENTDDKVMVELTSLPAAVSAVIVGSKFPTPCKVFPTVPVYGLAHTVEEARSLMDAGVAALIVCGQEGGTSTAYESGFVLLQRVLKLVNGKLPVWVKGGMGLHTVAAPFVAGAVGVIVDSILSVYPESRIPEGLKKKLMAWDGSESAAGLQAQFDGWAVGQDAALAREAYEEYPSLRELWTGLEQRIQAQCAQARDLDVLKPGNPWASGHGVALPIAQGPMTRVSDCPEFAHEVAKAGGLPFVALSLLNEASSRELLEGTQRLLAGKPWGAGVLGFADASILDPQLRLIEELKPDVLLIAGGRPSQARRFEALGIPSYLHVPSPGLLDMFIKEGARSFVFEGRECGGHVGPRYSFVLWHQAVNRLLREPSLSGFRILFAGGIHDEVSAAMVSVIAAPLVAKGASVGVLMGTAYMATHEAVHSKAILPKFQEQVLSAEHTALIETAPGHAVRMVPSPFIEYFESQKTDLKDQGVDAKDIWRQLEDLTVGRLRIASKGVDRVDGRLQEVPDNRQWSEGMYMIGQVCAMTSQAMSMQDLHGKVSTGAVNWLRQTPLPQPLLATAKPEPVAIVGMSAIYPGSPDLESYWDTILSGKDLVGEVPADRWSVDQYWDGGVAQPGKSVSKWGGFIEAVPFDPLKYGIPPASLAAIEPIQLLSLEAASAAIRDAGYEQRWYDKERTSVIFGAEAGMDLAHQYTFRNMWQGYAGAMPQALDEALPALTEDSFPGVLVNVISGRIANRLGLGGVNYAVTSACASSLTAIELAVKELRAGTSDMVLAGGADFHNSINDYMMFTSVGALSRKGRCRSFDHEADGIALGEGVGVIVLKRLSDAQADGDRIYAVIDGIAGSSDGKGLGLTAPRKEGQKRALTRAYAQAGVLPRQVELVEAHGTGTVVGDRTELMTLTDIYTQGGALPAQTTLGSVKSQIGHTKCAAGIAGLIKVSKALHHRVLPGTQGIAKPNPGYAAESSPFVFRNEATPWFSRGEVARAAVSAFGFGGANFHTVLSAYPEHQAPLGARVWPAELFALRGNTWADVMPQVKAALNYLRESNRPVALRDLALTLLQAGQGPVQCTWVSETPAALESTLSALQEGQLPAGVHRREVQAEAAQLAVLYSGQGSQHPGMLKDLFVYFPALQSVLDGEPELARSLFPPQACDEASREAQAKAVTDTRVAQPGLGAVEWAAHSWLKTLGIEGSMAAGHSYGELVALATSGAMDAATLLKLSKARAQAMLQGTDGDPGIMAAVSLDAPTLEPVLAGFPTVVLANQNSPTQTVIAGPTADVQAALEHLKAQGIAAKAIQTACAFHSPLMNKASESFAQVLRGQHFAALSRPVFKNRDAGLYAADGSDIAATLAAHIVEPVKFVAEVQAMYAAGARVFLEIGPKTVLGDLVRKIIPAGQAQVLSLDSKRSKLSGLLDTVAQLAVLLPDVELDSLFEQRAQVLDLAQAVRLSASAWMVDGGRAWPVKGSLPKSAGQVLKAPLSHLFGSPPQAATRSAAVAQASEPDEQAVLGYLQNMRELVNAQKDVLLSFLGSSPAPVRTRVIQSDASHPPLLENASRPVVELNPRASQAAQAKVVSSEQQLLEVVSDKTGYPTESLDLDLDLEADLSIDSIKRLEIVGAISQRLSLRQRLGDKADEVLEALGRCRSLRALNTCLSEHLPVDARAQDTAIETVVEKTPSAPATAPAQGKAVLLDVVSECTGYPVESLDLELDLEADLSIDSIKRLEIIGRLSQRLVPHLQGASKDDWVEKFHGKRTLKAMVALLDESASPVASVPEPLKQAKVDAPQQDDELIRYVFQNQSLDEQTRGLNLPANRVLILADDRGIAPLLQARLAARCVEVRVLGSGQWPQLDSALNGMDAVLVLQSLNQHASVLDAKSLFSVLKAAALSPVKHVLCVAGLGGQFDAAQGSPHRGAGLSGLCKTLAWEYPGKAIRYLDVDAQDSDAQLAEVIEDELFKPMQALEVASSNGERWTRGPLAQVLPVEALQGLKLNEQSVVLLTGGARGITALVAIELARRYRCCIELIGRSAWPEAEPQALAAVTDPLKLRQVLIQQQPGKKPAEIERLAKQILADREIRKTGQAIRQAGGTLAYTALDARDSVALGAHIMSLYEKHGRIDGVVHGAGILEDKLIADKSPESFERVFDTKVSPALTLWSTLKEDTQFVVFFSSVASAFGNRGQVDYSSANSVLDGIAQAWNARGNTHVLAVNWGPWAGTGMVSEGLKKEYDKKGIGLVPQVAGVHALLDELANPHREAQVILMAAKPESMAIPTPRLELA